MKCFGDRRTRLTAIAGAIATAGIIATCGPAYAHHYSGEFSVTGLGVGGTSATAVGANRGPHYCTDFVEPAASVPHSTFTAAVAPSQMCSTPSNPNQLPEGKYVVAYGHFSTSGGDQCAEGQAVGYTKLGQMDVDRSGYGSGIYDIPVTADLGLGVVCVAGMTPPTDYYGNELRVLVL